MDLIVTNVRPYGAFDTVIVFEGTTDDGATVAVGVDHRPAQQILASFWRGFAPRITVEDWQVLSTTTTGGTTK